MYIPGHYILNLIHSLNNNKFFPFSNQSSHPRNKKIALWGHNKLAIAQYVRPALLHLVKFWAGIKYKTNHVFTLIFRRCGARKNYEIEKNPTNFGLIVNEGFSKKSGGCKNWSPPLPPLHKFKTTLWILLLFWPKYWTKEEKLSSSTFLNYPWI